MISETDRIETRKYPHREGRPPVVSLCLPAIFVQRRYRGGIPKAFDQVNTPFFHFDFLENKSLGTSLVCQRFPKNKKASSGGFRTSTNQSPILIFTSSLIQGLRICPPTDSVVFKTCRLVVSSSSWPITELYSRQILSRRKAVSYGLGIIISTFLEFNKSSQVPIVRK